MEEINVQQKWLPLTMWMCQVKSAKINAKKKNKIWKVFFFILLLVVWLKKMYLSVTFIWEHWYKNRHRHEYDKNTVVSIQIN